MLVTIVLILWSLLKKRRRRRRKSDVEAGKKKRFYCCGDAVGARLFLLVAGRQKSDFLGSSLPSILRFFVLKKTASSLFLTILQFLFST